MNRGLSTTKTLPNVYSKSQVQIIYGSQNTFGSMSILLLRLKGI